MAMRKFVVVREDDSFIICTGEFPDLRTAIGEVMLDILEFKRDYCIDDEWLFEISDMERLEGETGEVIAVTYKSPKDEHSRDMFYYILFLDENEK